MQKQVPKAVDAGGCGNGLLAYQCTTSTRNHVFRFFSSTPSTLSTSKRKRWQEAAGLQGGGPSLKAAPSHCLMWYIQPLPSNANSSSNSNIRLIYLLKKSKKWGIGKSRHQHSVKAFYFKASFLSRAT